MIKKVVIAGGGTAGWIAAAALSKILGKKIDIQLIESRDIPTVGVGEATIPLLGAFHEWLEINEQRFLSSVQGTFKLGIRFENWKNIGENYIHAFGSTRADTKLAGFQHYWLKARMQGDNTPYSAYSVENEAANRNKFIVKALNRESKFSSTLAYAYHFDAKYYVNFLAKFSAQYGVTRTEGTIKEVLTDHASGNITALRLASGELIEGDFFIDCTGFRALLIGQTLHTGFDDWSHWLPCDSAVATQTTSVEEPVPYTRAIAHTAGWQWRIPLQHRVGAGLVYCSRYMTAEDAEKQLLETIPGRQLTPINHLKFRTGTRHKHWNKNCVALGLASGFLEPLESTSIHFIQKNITRLIQMFPHEGISPSLVDEFNRQTRAEMENVRDFLVLHYHATERDDTPFWRYCKGMTPPESLQRRLDLFKETGRFFRDTHDLFGESSWVQVLLGQGIVPQQYHPIVDTISQESFAASLAHLRSTVKNVVDHLPTHQQFIDSYCKADPVDV